MSVVGCLYFRLFYFVGLYVVACFGYFAWFEWGFDNSVAGNRFSLYFDWLLVWRWFVIDSVALCVLFMLYVGLLLFVGFVDWCGWFCVLIIYVDAYDFSCMDYCD